MVPSRRMVLSGSVIIATFVLLIPDATAAADDQVSRIIPLPQVEESRWICAEHGRVYVVDKKDIAVYAFADGRFLRKVGGLGQGPGEFRVKVTREFRAAVQEDRKKSKYWDYVNAVFPEFLPAFFGFKIDAGRIYVITTARKDGLYEVIETDLNGKILERNFRFPIKPRFDIPPEAFALQYDVEGGKFLWVEYNEAKEIYELHVR